MDNNKLNRPVFINITALTVIKIIMVFILFYFLYLVRDILAIFFVSLVLASAVDPWIDWMQTKKNTARLRRLLYLYYYVCGRGNDHISDHSADSRAG